jgi:hypothetical protein
VARGVKVDDAQAVQRLEASRLRGYNAGVQPLGLVELSLTLQLDRAS